MNSKKIKKILTLLLFSVIVNVLCIPVYTCYYDLLFCDIYGDINLWYISQVSAFTVGINIIVVLCWYLINLLDS